MALFRKRYPALLLTAVLLSLLFYWGRLLYAGVWQQDPVAPDMGGLARYLLGIVVLLTALWALAFANYRLAFRRWLLSPDKRLYYRTWLSGLAWLVFELL